MFLNVDQLEKQLDNKEFQEIGSMASFKVLETQFQMFINSQIYLNDEYIVMTRNYFLEYTRLDIPEFRDTLIQNMDYVKKSIEKRALHKMEYDSRVNERLMQTTEEKVDSSKALDASLVIIESNGTESQEQDTSSRSGNDAHVDDADIRPIYNEEPMAEISLLSSSSIPADYVSASHVTVPADRDRICSWREPLIKKNHSLPQQNFAEINIFATGQQHTEQPEFNNEGKTIELLNQLLESENVCLKKTVAQCLKDFSILEAHCINLELKYQNQVLKEGKQDQILNVRSNEAKVKTGIDVTETINIELEHSVAKLLAENEQLHKEKEHLKQTYKDLFDSNKRPVPDQRPDGLFNGAQLNKKYSLKYRYIVQSYKGRTQSLVAEKTNISENWASRNFADQASVFMAMMFDHNNSDLAPQRQEMSVENVSSGLVPQGQKASDYDNSDPVLPRQNVVPSAEKPDSSHQGLEFLFSPTLTPCPQDKMITIYFSPIRVYF
ncbi:hypothetical protein Tco_1090422 [Tanacetum coccineum]|uniref:Uncharacterized protein n=1 Tax=Tanacetum coccineum TaxID=301880 RepID=A0ABQ5I5E2_9ASTR